MIRFWVSEFDVDGIRLDAADVMDFEYMKALRRTANEVKPDFWLMGEVIHGDYIRWANADTLHSVTNYHLHKALFSGYNDHNFFEIAHTVKRLNDMCGGVFKLYNFVDNHDVERIMSKLSTPKGFVPVHILLYTLPGVPSIYYGSEFGIEGKKAHGVDADAPLRPEMDYDSWTDAMEENAYVKFITALGAMHKQVKALSYGDYKEQNLTTRQYTFSRSYEGSTVVVMVNNDDNACTMNGGAPDGKYVGAISGREITVSGGWFSVEIAGNSGEIWVPVNAGVEVTPVEEPIVAEEPVVVEEPVVAEEPVVVEEPVVAEETPVVEETSVVEEVPEVEELAVVGTTETDEVEKETEESGKVLDLNKPYEEMTIEELQASILEKMAKNGPVTDEMRRTVEVNNHQGSLLNWVRSFN